MTKSLELSADNKLVQVIDITFQMLAVVERDGFSADDRCEGIGRVREVDECKHVVLNEFSDQVESDGYNSLIPRLEYV